MPEFISRLQQKAIDLWKVLDKSQKRRIYVISAILIAVLAVTIVLATKSNYVPLIKSSDSKDVSDMTKILQDQNIKFKLDQNSGTIMIDSKDNNKAQVALIQGGFPKSGMTFEDAFSSIKINTTESDKQKLWQHYDESTLSAKLKMLADNIEDASVTISKPEDTPFVIDENNTQKPSANVIVKPKSELTQKQVQGIVMMVASSVVGLDPKDVTVLDNNLNIMNSQNMGNSIDEVNSQYDMKQKTQKALENSVYNLFNKVPLDSFESIRAVVNPVLDFDKLTRQTNDISNGTGMDGPAVISSEKTKEKLTNGNTSGIPGTDTNPGSSTTTTYPINSNGNSNYDKTTEKINNDYKRTVTDEEKALGAVNLEKSSMTVALYYGRRVKDDKNLTQAFIDSLKNDVSRATGIPLTNISVNKYKMAPETVETKSLSDTIKELVNAYGFFALILLLIIGLMIALIPRKKKGEQNEPQVATPEPALAAAGAGGFDVTVNDEMELQEIDIEERSEVKKQIEKFVKQKPDAVAQLLRNWLSDDWE
ncbi:MAG: flagellar basal-body MS-ring/collar protein FliF [Bacillota bacterium]|nr:flagellar basal-body MS-ring/collar protein FliF [Bacillota bacterium]